MKQHNLATQPRELELREDVHKLGYDLRRSPVDDPAHPAYDHYMIVDNAHHLVVAGYEPFDFSLDLDGVADWVKTNAAGAPSR